MSDITVKWADRHLANYGARLAQLNAQFPKALPQTINQVGNRAKTQVIRTLTKQTGLKRTVIVKAIGHPAKARPGLLNYTMITAGGNIRLKYLQPRETRAGVTAMPFGKRTLFPGTFMKGGRFPDRKTVSRFDGHVYRRLDTRGRKITQVRSGMRIPTEMTSGATAQAFQDIAGPLLKERVDKLIAKLAP